MKVRELKAVFAGADDDADVIIEWQTTVAGGGLMTINPLDVFEVHGAVKQPARRIPRPVKAIGGRMNALAHRLNLVLRTVEGDRRSDECHARSLESHPEGSESDRATHACDRATHARRPWSEVTPWPRRSRTRQNGERARRRSE
jgi:hypothetical protein